MARSRSKAISWAGLKGLSLSPIRAPHRPWKAAPCVLQLRALRPELSRRLARIATAEEAVFNLARDGRVRFEGAAIAKLAHGAPLLKPRLELIGAENADERERTAARERLEYWLARKVGADLRRWCNWKPPGAKGACRPMRAGCLRLIENAGALDRRGEAIDHISGEAQAVLRRLGVRIGRVSVFVPASSARARLRRWRIAPRRAAEPSARFFSCRAQARSAPLDQQRPWAELAAAGYRGCGRIAVRFDIAEKLADALAAPEPPPRRSWRARSPGPRARACRRARRAWLQKDRGRGGPAGRAPAPARAPRLREESPFAALAADAGLAPARRRRRKRKSA